jgi:hypothetical protein
MIVYLYKYSPNGLVFLRPRKEKKNPPSHDGTAGD